MQVTGEMEVIELIDLHLQDMIMMLFKTESMKFYPLKAVATQAGNLLILCHERSLEVTGEMVRIEKTDLKEPVMTITLCKEE